MTATFPRKGKTKKELLAMLKAARPSAPIDSPTRLAEYLASTEMDSYHKKYEGTWLKQEPDWLIETALHEGQFNFDEAREIAQVEWRKMEKHLLGRRVRLVDMKQDTKIAAMTAITRNMIKKFKCDLPGEIIVQIVEDELNFYLCPF